MPDSGPLAVFLAMTFPFAPPVQLPAPAAQLPTAFAPTPMPSAAQIDAGLRLVDAGAWAAEDALLELLEALLPPAIARANVRLGYHNGKGIKVPGLFRAAPTLPTDDYLNSICVRCHVEKEPDGLRAFQNVGTIEVFSIEERADAPRQARSAKQRAGLIYGVMLPFLGGFTTGDGVRVWSAMEPGLTTSLPDSYAAYSGATAHFFFRQGPECNCWRT